MCRRLPRSSPVPPLGLDLHRLLLTSTTTTMTTAARCRVEIILAKGGIDVLRVFAERGWIIDSRSGHGNDRYIGRIVLPRSLPRSAPQTQETQALPIERPFAGLVREGEWLGTGKQFRQRTAYYEPRSFAGTVVIWSQDFGSADKRSSTNNERDAERRVEDTGQALADEPT